MSSARINLIGDFWSTGIWVGLRIFLVPSLVFAGFYAFKHPQVIGLSPAQMNPIPQIMEKSLSQIGSAFGTSHAKRSYFTPGTGAKWIRVKN